MRDYIADSLDVYLCKRRNQYACTSAHVMYKVLILFESREDCLCAICLMMLSSSFQVRAGRCQVSTRILLIVCIDVTSPPGKRIMIHASMCTAVVQLASYDPTAQYYHMCLPQLALPIHTP